MPRTIEAIVPFPEGHILDDATITVPDGLRAHFEETGMDAGRVLSVKPTDERDGLVYEIELTDDANELLMISPAEYLTLGNDRAITNPRRDDDPLDSVEAFLTDADYHDRGRDCNNPACPDCYEQVAIEQPNDARAEAGYIAELEDHLERRETAARLLDKILKAVGSPSLEARQGEPITWTLAAGGRLEVEVDAKDLRYMEARERAGFTPDSA